MRNLTEQAQYFAEIQEYLVTGASELFRGFGLPVEHSLGSADVQIVGPSVMAVIGYAAPLLRGALLLLTSTEVVATLQPSEVRTQEPTEGALRDVLGEFANMLVGRIKNKLITRSLAPLISTPTTIFALDLKLPVPTGGMSAWHRFASKAGDIYVRLDATFDQDFALSAVTPTPSDPPLAEGEMVLF